MQAIKSKSAYPTIASAILGFLFFSCQLYAVQASVEKPGEQAAPEFVLNFDSGEDKGNSPPLSDYLMACLPLPQVPYSVTFLMQERPLFSRESTKLYLLFRQLKVRYTYRIAMNEADAKQFLSYQ